MKLQFLAQIFKDHVADQRGDESDPEVGDGEDVRQSRRQGLAAAVGCGELAHQQVGVKEKVDKADLDHRPPQARQSPATCPLALHGNPIVQEANEDSVRAAGLTPLGPWH